MLVQLLYFVADKVAWHHHEHGHQEAPAVMRTAAATAFYIALAPLVAANDLLKAIDKNNLAQLNMALKSVHPKVVNQPDAEGNTPLMVAVAGGKHKVIKALLKGGADATVPDPHGYTVMHVAAAQGHERGEGRPSTRRGCPRRLSTRARHRWQSSRCSSRTGLTQETGTPTA